MGLFLWMSEEFGNSSPTKQLTIKPYKNFPKQPYQGSGYQLKSKPQIEKQSFIQSCWTSGKSWGCLPHLCQRLPPPPTSPQTPWLFYGAMAGHDTRGKVARQVWLNLEWKVDTLHSDALSVQVANPVENEWTQASATLAWDHSPSK